MIPSGADRGCQDGGTSVPWDPRASAGTLGWPLVLATARESLNAPRWDMSPSQPLQLLPGAEGGPQAVLINRWPLMSFVCLSSGFGGRSTGSGWCHGRVDTAGLNSGSGAARRRGAPQDGALAPCLPQPWLPFSHSHGSSSPHRHRGRILTRRCDCGPAGTAGLAFGLAVSRGAAALMGLRLSPSSSWAPADIGGSVRMQPFRVTSGSKAGQRAAEAPPARRCAMIPGFSSPPHLHPSVFLAFLSPLSLWTLSRGDVCATEKGKGGKLENCPPPWRCSGDAQGMLRLSSRKAETPPGVMDPRLLHQLHPSMKD